MRLLRWSVLVAISLPLFGCVSGVAAGVVGAAVVVGFATRSCYDHVRITVFDGTGHRTCNAKVEVKDGDDVTKLESCYYAQLTEGQYVIEASLPEHVTETQKVVVAPRKRCQHSVHTMEISLKSTHAPPPAPPIFAPPPPPPTAAPAAAPPAAPPPAAPPPATAPPSAAPTTPPPAAAPQPSVAPAPPAAPVAPPVQRFPD
jgi:hypothetical protein